ncbi:DUF488 domain-containing protein [Actinocrinis sp.]|uniref:DUF488 domain-containing protein n=1 Tax=Actinocrinis sp. TaxID=1920516 RepID=UPI002C02DE2A|nr:DUF488 family protein [Actinocrinis sp.]HXR70044.1 DUF488 family protein [Actinocrinis sp.]
MADRFRMKRVHDDPSPQDGERVLVDRLWPRGVSKERAALDDWAKDAAPSNELRKWFHEAPDERREEFADRYAAELDGPDQSRKLDELRARAAKHTVTLLTATKDVEHSHVPILLKQLKHK